MAITHPGQATSIKQDSPSEDFPKGNKPSWVKWAIVLGVMAFVAIITIGIFQILDTEKLKREIMLRSLSAMSCENLLRSQHVKPFYDEITGQYNFTDSDIKEIVMRNCKDYLFNISGSQSSFSYFLTPQKLKFLLTQFSVFTETNNIGDPVAFIIAYRLGDLVNDEKETFMKRFAINLVPILDPKFNSEKPISKVLQTYFGTEYLTDQVKIATEYLTPTIKSKASPLTAQYLKWSSTDKTTDRERSLPKAQAYAWIRVSIKKWISPN